MGTWGPGLYSDDTALDVKGQYRDLLREGTAPDEATNKLIEDFAIGDLTDDTAFWLALADTQWHWGYLEDRVKQNALHIINEGIDLARWEEQPYKSDVRLRKKTLEKLRARLESPQPLSKKLPQPYINKCPWKIGEAISYRLNSGQSVLFRVVGHDTSYGGIVPVMELLDWVGDAPPPKEQIATLKPMKPVNPRDPKLHIFSQEAIDQLKAEGKIPEHATAEEVMSHVLSAIPQFVIYRKASRELPRRRCTKLGRVFARDEQLNPLALIGVRWQYLDNLLQDYFDLGSSPVWGLLDG